MKQTGSIKLKGLWQTCVLVCLIGLSHAWAKTPEQDHQLNLVYTAYCDQLRELYVDDRYAVDCFHNYHHYNADSATRYYHPTRARQHRQLRMASFNLWHPGTARSALKNYSLMAELMNRWDIVAAQELLASVSRDLKHNEEVIKFLEQGPELVRSLTNELRLDPTNTALRERLEVLKRDLRIAPQIYRPPGYLVLLEELRKLDPSWSLILAPRGEAAEPQHVHELSGFFYRASVVRPELNSHCREFPERERNGTPYACIPHLDRSFMGRDTAEVFSRRPFMASFKSYQFDFTMLTSHVIFTTPRSPEAMSKIMQAAFGVDSYEGLGTGMTLANYARWAEVKLTLEFMERFKRRYRQSRLIFSGDMNLVSSSAFWDVLFQDFPGKQVLVDDPTTVSLIRYRADGSETFGVANNYDHFILDSREFRHCEQEGDRVKARAYSFFEGPIGNKIRRFYNIRSERKSQDEGEDEFDEPVPPRPLVPDYQFTSNAQRIIDSHLADYDQQLHATYTLSRDGRIVFDDYRIEQRRAVFVQRLFTDQLYDRTYYRLYPELLSDHLPIEMNCSTSLR